MSDLEVAAKVITDLQAQIKGLKGQLNLYRWGMGGGVGPDVPPVTIFSNPLLWI